LAVNYQKEIGSKVNLVIDNKAFEGTLMEISHANSSLKIKVNYLAQKLERIYSFSLISVLDNVKRLKKENADEQSLLQFLYLLQNKKYDLALENLEKYNGVLRKEMLVSMRESQNKQAEIAWSGLLGFMKLDQSLDDNSFVESFQKLRLLDGDAWEANRQLLLFMKRYELSGFYNENKLRVSLLQRLLMKLSESEKDPDFIVSANGVPGTVTLEKAIREVNSGGLIRLLPGNYLGNIIIDRKLTLQGCSGVNIEDNMSLDTDRIKMSHLNFTKGYLELHRRVRDISISRLSFKKSGIKMRGENTSVVIENTLMRGLTVGECRQLVINNSVILDELEANSNKGFAIKGFISGQLNNTIVYSKTSFAMNMTERMDSSLSLKYCLIYGKLGLAQLSREKLSIIDLSSFARKVGRTLNSEIAEPQFISPETNDFGLKDFTPGFLAGEGKRSIGIQY
jgi:hypothetical protein